MINSRFSSRSLTLSPKDFLRQLEYGFSGGDRVLVDGNLVITENDNILVIPEARVRGFVSIERCMSLTFCALSVDKDLSIADCPSLVKIKGKTEGLRLMRVGIETLGADLEIEGDLNAVDCPKFSKINCHVGGGLIIAGSHNLQAGPAFSCEGTSMINGVYSRGMGAGFPLARARGGQSEAGRSNQRDPDLAW